MTEALRVILVANDVFLQNGIKSVLSQAGAIDVVGETDNLPQARQMAELMDPSLFVIDPAGMRSDANDIVNYLKDDTADSSTPMILVSGDESLSKLDAFRAGVVEVHRSRTSAAELVAAVRMAGAGYVLVERAFVGRLTYAAVLEEENVESLVAFLLTKREEEVFHLIVQGMSNAEIAVRLTVACSTVKCHVQQVLRKLGVRNRMEAVIYAHHLQTVAAVAPTG